MQVEDASNTLILFEEVDTLCDDDRGFMAALSSLVATAKRPLVLTSNREAVPGLPMAHVRRVHLHTPPQRYVVQHGELRARWGDAKS